MAIDLPPVIPPQESSAEKILQYVPANAAAIRARIHNYELQLTGNRYLDEQEIVALFRKSKSPSDAIKALNNAYYLKGHMLVTVYYGVRDAVLYVHVIQGEVKDIEAPKQVKQYFEPLIGKAEPSLEDFESSRVMADIRSTRSGYDYGVKYRVDGDPAAFTLNLAQRDNPDYQPVSLSLRANNQGNRFLGRYFAGVDLGAHFRDSTELKLSYDGGLVDLGEVEGGKSYDALNLSISRIIGNGIYSLSAGETRYVRELSVESNSVECLYPLGLVDGLLTGLLGLPSLLGDFGELIGVACDDVSGTQMFDLDGKNTMVNFAGEQIVSAGRTHRLVLTQKFKGIDSSVVSDASNQVILDEKTLTAELGLRYYQGFKLFGAPARFDIQLAAEKGLNSDNGTMASDEDESSVSVGRRSADFLIYKPKLGLKIGMGDWGKLALNTTAQLSDDVQLPQQHQWVMGGAGALTAFLPGILVGDSGYYGRFAWELPTWKPWDGAEIKPSLFYEEGAAWYEDVSGDLDETRQVSDAGFSVSAKLGWGLESALTVAEPVKTKGVSEDLEESLEVDFFWSLKKRF